MRKGAILSFLLFFMLTGVGAVSAAPAERILSFYSDIEVHVDGGGGW